MGLPRSQETLPHMTGSGSCDGHSSEDSLCSSIQVIRSILELSEHLRIETGIHIT